MAKALGIVVVDDPQRLCHQQQRRML